MYVLKIVRRNIRRTPYQALAASMVMFLTFLTLFLFAVLAIGLQNALQNLENKPQVIAFFKDNTLDTDVEAIENALTQTGRVSKTHYVNKDEALKIYQDKNKNEPLLLELVSANILPTSLEVSTYNPTDLQQVADMLKKEPVVEDILYPFDVVDQLTKTTSIVRSAGSIAVGFLIVFSLLVLIMIIGFKIRIKRNEIETMKLLGASTWFIRAPFILEGMIYGLIGSVSAGIVGLSIIWYMTPFVEKDLREFGMFPIPLSFWLLLFSSLIGISIVIGFMGSYSAVRRYLKL